MPSKDSKSAIGPLLCSRHGIVPDGHDCGAPSRTLDAPAPPASEETPASSMTAELWSFARRCIQTGYDTAESHGRFPKQRSYEELSADLDARAGILVNDPRAARVYDAVLAPRTPPLDTGGATATADQCPSTSKTNGLRCERFVGHETPHQHRGVRGFAVWADEVAGAEGPAREFPAISSEDVGAVAVFLDERLTKASSGKHGVILSWNDAKGFALVLHAAAETIASPALPCPTCGTRYTARSVATPSPEGTGTPPTGKQSLQVHNHGPEEGPGLACRETVFDGVRLGACLNIPTANELLGRTELVVGGDLPGVGPLEQQARDLLERAGVEHAQSMTSGDLVEVANLLDELARLRLQAAAGEQTIERAAVLLEKAGAPSDAINIRATLAQRTP